METERRRSQDFQYGEMIATLKSIEGMMIRFEKHMDKMDTKLENHEKEDNEIHAKVIVLENWKEGGINNDGADKIIRDYQRNKWTMHGITVTIATAVAYISNIFGGHH